ncbi:MAG: ABC transporter ATP-binding protein [Tissierellia bacterium]|nr:ABC transporter ATP-binding protein [Tissierellia bacterium]
MEIKHVNFSYGKQQVIHDLSISFPRGKITTLLGSNGCGKTTLFKLCTRELTTRRGLIKLDGKNIKDIKRKEFAKKVAIVHQQNRITGDITVRELVSYGRNPYIGFMQRYTEEDYKEVDRAIALCELEEISHKKVLSLSGGQLQRVWLALAIAQNTDILFLDEPTTYLDIKYQIEILKLVRKLNQELGTTIVMVLHDINQSLEYSDYIVGMYQGRIEFQGPPIDTIKEENISKIYDTNLIVETFKNRKIVLPKEAG